jgi:hypothetical protein
LTSIAAFTDEPNSGRNAAIVAVALSTGLNALGVFTEEAIHWVNLLIGFGAAVLAALVVFGWFVRRARRDPARAWRTAVVCSVLGLLAVAAFWSGLPPVLGVAGAQLGLLAHRAAGSTTARRLGAAAAAVGVLAVALDVVAYLTDVLSRT